MTIEYEWFIDQIKTLQTPEPNFVTHVNWRVMATKEGEKAVSQGGITLGKVSETFVPYEQLTETIVIGWVKDTLGENMVNDIIESLKEQLEPSKPIIETPQQKPLPWLES